MTPASKSSTPITKMVRPLFSNMELPPDMMPRASISHMAIGIEEVAASRSSGNAVETVVVVHHPCQIEASPFGDQVFGRHSHVASGVFITRALGRKEIRIAGAMKKRGVILNIGSQ